MKFVYKLSYIQYKKIIYIDNKKSLFYTLLKKIIIFYFIFFNRNRLKKLKKKFKGGIIGSIKMIDHLFCTLPMIIIKFLNIYLLKKKFINFAKKKNNKNQENKLIVNFYKLFLCFNNMHLSLFLILSAKKIIFKIEGYIDILLNGLKIIKQKKNYNNFNYIFLFQQIALTINNQKTKVEKYMFSENISIKKTDYFMYTLNICIESYLKNILKKTKNKKYNKIKRINLINFKKKRKIFSQEIEFWIRVFFTSIYFLPGKIDLTFLCLTLKYVKILLKKVKRYFFAFIFILLKKYFLSFCIHFRYLRTKSFLLILNNFYKKTFSFYIKNEKKNTFIYFFENYLLYNEPLLLISYIHMIINGSKKFIGRKKSPYSAFGCVLNFNLSIICLKNILKNYKIVNFETV